MDPKDTAEIIVSVLGFGGTITALALGLQQYKRSEKWKRGEFVAKEIKEFEANPAVRNAMLMIDWSARKINLYHAENPDEGDYVRITREDQWRALLPHPVKPGYPSLFLQKEDLEVSKRRFTSDEAKIRDTYDAFLDHLERFAHFVQSGLVSAEEFKPYLIYWIESIADVEDPADAGDPEQHCQDAKWRFALLTYIHYYKYTGVQFLFNCYGWNIAPGGEACQKLKALMQDDQLHDDCLSELVGTNKNGRVASK